MSDQDGSPEGNDLFEPSIEQAPSTPTERPWDPTSQFYVAFFGGVVAVTAIAFLNALRFPLTWGRRRAILGIGFLGLVAVAVLAAVMPIETGTSAFLNEGSRNIRIAGRVVAVLVCLAFVRLQQPGDRLFRIRGGTYASLWGPGIAAALVGGLAQAAVVLVVVNAR